MIHCKIYAERYAKKYEPSGNVPDGRRNSFTSEIYFIYVKEDSPFEDFPL